jgi:hypothetical protein
MTKLRAIRKLPRAGSVPRREVAAAVKAVIAERIARDGFDAAKHPNRKRKMISK